MQRADLQVVLSMTNGLVCFAVMLFPCSAVEIADTSPIRADNDFIPRCFSVCVCVLGERTKGGARGFVCVRGKTKNYGFAALCTFELVGVAFSHCICPSKHDPPTARRHLHL